MKATIKVLAILAGLNTAYFCMILTKRLQLDFNAEGRYFDEASGIVIHQQSVLVVAVLFAAGLLVTVALAVTVRKLKA